MESLRTDLVIVFVILLWCSSLRDVQLEENKKMSTSLSHREFMLKMQKRGRPIEYNPNPGYEPYWDDGEWVLSTTTVRPGTSTTKMPKICGDECHYLWRRIKEVCGRKSDATNIVGCYPNPDVHHYCYGKPGDFMDPGFRTFKTYCEFLEAQCRDKFSDHSRYVLVHVGPCRKLEESFLPVWESSQPVSRADQFMFGFQEFLETERKRKLVFMPELVG